MKKKRNKTAHGCLQLLAVPVVMTFIVTAILAVLVTGLSFTFASRISVKSAVSLDEFVREFMTQSIEQDIRQKYLAQSLPPPEIDSIAIRHAVDLLVPPDWIDNAVDQGIDNIFNFLEAGRTDAYEFDFRPLLERFRSETGHEAMTIIVGSYPPCPPSYFPTFEYNQEHNVEIECLPSGVPVSQVADQVYTTLIAGFNSDPELLANGGIFREEWSPTTASDAEIIIRAFQVLDQLWLLWLIPLGLLAIIALLTVRSLYSLGIWFGSTLLITGVVTPVVGLIIFVQILDWLQYLLDGLGTSEDPLGQLTIELVTNAIYTLHFNWLISVLIQAGLMFLLGGSGLVLALLLKIFYRNPGPKNNMGGVK